LTGDVDDLVLSLVCVLIDEAPMLDDVELRDACCVGDSLDEITLLGTVELA
jgi:hypothetical protein